MGPTSTDTAVLLTHIVALHIAAKILASLSNQSKDEWLAELLRFGAQGVKEGKPAQLQALADEILQAINA